MSMPHQGRPQTAVRGMTEMTEIAVEQIKVLNETSNRSHPNLFSTVIKIRVPVLFQKRPRSTADYSTLWGLGGLAQTKAQL
jgi:hypothetical protein